MLILALDTSGAAVTVAVHDGTAVRADAARPAARGHAEQLAPLVVEVLAAAAAGVRDLTAIAVGVGPGPFTGLRAGIVTGRVLGYALGVEVIGICSLDAIAAAAVQRLPAGEREFFVATDARRREVYWAGYATVLPELALPRRPPAGADPVLRAARFDGPHVGPAAGIDRAGRRVVGRGALLYPAELLAPATSPEPLDVDAGALARLAVRGLAAGADEHDRAVLLPPEPLYLRRPDATQPGPRKRVLPVAGR
jgi:tRNA threonylcarbamoyladenosine biosynthesis protein TsaB